MTSPNPAWKPGDKIEPPFTEMVQFDATKLPAPEIYRIMISTIVPRPIAVVSTINGTGQNNVAPFSFFNGISSNPPCVVLGVGTKPDGSTKDTLNNILETKEFVINTANEWMIEPVVYSAGLFPPEVDEIKLTGLTAIPSVKVKPPRIAESAVQFECTLFQAVPLGSGRGSSTLIIGKIELIHVATEALKEGRVDSSALKNIARLGGISYAKISDIFEIPVPKV